MARDSSNPTRYIATSAGGCGSGFAASTAPSGSTFQLYSIPGTLIAAVADNTVTAGDVVMGDRWFPAGLQTADSPLAAAFSTLPASWAWPSRAPSPGGTFTVTYDGVGTYLTALPATVVQKDASGNIIAGAGVLPQTYAAPATAPTATLAGSAGTLSVGIYTYMVTFSNGAGETGPSPASSPITVVTPASSGQINLSAIPTDPSGLATARKSVPHYGRRRVRLLFCVIHCRQHDDDLYR